jgi:hypothetical protein
MRYAFHRLIARQCAYCTNAPNNGVQRHEHGRALSLSILIIDWNAQFARYLSVKYLASDAVAGLIDTHNCIHQVTRA